MQQVCPVGRWDITAWFHSLVLDRRSYQDRFCTFFSRKWREEKAALLSKMDSEEKEEIEEWRERAKKELHDWYERRDEQLGKTQTTNR